MTAPATTTAQILDQALAAAPDLFVDDDSTGAPTLWRDERGGDPAQTLVFATPRGITEADMRLIGLLLAAAPHLVRLLDADEDHDRPCVLGEDHDCAHNHLRRMCAAIRDAA